MNVKLRYTVILRDARGRVVRRYTRRSRSFVVGFLRHLRAMLGSMGETANDTAGVSRAVTIPNSLATPWGDADGPLNVDTYGIVVGTGTAAESINDYALATQVAHGNGAGQLEHLASIIDAVVVSAPSASFKVRRTFNNNSGGAIVVNEIGMYVQTRESIPTTRYYCVIRDLLAAGDSIPNGGAYQVAYTIQITV